MKQGIFLIIVLMGCLIACSSEPPLTATPTSTATPQAPTLTPVPTATPTPQAPTLTPVPTATPTPLDRALNNGDWVFFHADCPDRYANCAPVPSDINMIALEAQKYTPPIDDAPAILIICADNLTLLTFKTYINLPDKSTVTLNNTEFRSHRVKDDAVDFIHTNNMFRLIREAEQAQQLVKITVSDGMEEVLVSWFNPLGFTTNFTRLPCVI